MVASGASNRASARELVLSFRGLPAGKLVRTVIVFAVLFVAGIILAAGARAVADALDQLVLISVGSAIPGGSLAFFLVEMFRLDSER